MAKTIPLMITTWLTEKMNIHSIRLVCIAVNVCSSGLSLRGLGTAIMAIEAL